MIGSGYYQHIVLGTAVCICLALLFRNWQQEAKTKRLERRLISLEKNVKRIQMVETIQDGKVRLGEKCIIENDKCIIENDKRNNNDIDIDSNCSLGTLLDSDEEKDEENEEVKETNTFEIHNDDNQNEDLQFEELVELHGDEELDEELEELSADSENMPLLEDDEIDSIDEKVLAESPLLEDEVSLDDPVSLDDSDDEIPEFRIDEATTYDPKGKRFADTIAKVRSFIDSEDVSIYTLQMELGDQKNNPNSNNPNIPKIEELNDENNQLTEEKDESPTAEQNAVLTSTEELHTTICPPVNQCTYKITRGKRSGMLCGEKCFKNRTFCNRHYMRSEKNNNSVNATI